MRAIQAPHPGGPEVLTSVELPKPDVQPGHVLVRVAAAGINFIDTYRRSGIYPTPFPHVPGSEGAGEVVEVGDDVAAIAVGDHIAWREAPGSYAEFVNVRADQALPVPGDMDLDVAAALPLQGMTAHYLATASYPIQAGDTVLIHAGAGGVGLLLTQLAVMRGATVIATTSTQDKAELVCAAGAHHVVRYDEFDDLGTQLPQRVDALTGGDGVAAVYDGVGASTFDASLASLRRRGTLVLFGGASGQVPPFDPQRLNAAGSVFLTRPKLDDYVASRDELVGRWKDLTRWVAEGSLDVRIGARFALDQAAAAQTALESRRTTGKVLLLP